ncbi:helix-turn-helix domain-containing protein [Streptomyces sp. NPDC050535]|uniref:MmyB family transcriptional regulator n=1 Tax=Streptomyces sp. NPDC050535 TaxID=3365626 RepID=UPI003798F0A0
MSNREALQELLRLKRAQIDPVELGLPRRTGRGRRPKGLSQSQVADALELSERTYADLERGDMATPTAEFLDNVARVLRMEEPERSALYVYSLGHEPPVPMDPTAGTSVAPAWLQAVRNVSGQPSYVSDVAWNILGANDDFVRMFPQRPGAPPRLPERNLIRWMLLHEEAREHHLVDWETRWAKPVAAQLRTAVAAHPENRDIQQLDTEVNDDAVAGPIYRRHDLAYVHPDGDTRHMRHSGFVAQHGTDDRRDRCCERHAPSQLGTVTMCAAQPLGSPGARFLFLVFEPTRQPLHYRNRHE